MDRLCNYDQTLIHPSQRPHSISKLEANPDGTRVARRRGEKVAYRRAYKYVSLIVCPPHCLSALYACRSSLSTLPRSARPPFRPVRAPQRRSRARRSEETRRRASDNARGTILNPLPAPPTLELRRQPGAYLPAQPATGIGRRQERENGRALDERRRWPPPCRLSSP